ncbi:MAG: ornithine cyclodeaminase family protein [Bacteriovorax sp.]|jgi:ornithine cyclodeaminase/alanine dehydrogenase
MLYLSRKDVESVNLPMTEIIQSLETMFLDKGMGKTEMPPKPGIHTRPDAFIHAMPAYIPSMKSAGMKWVSGYPENQKKGLKYINGLLILNDDETGIPLSVMDCTWITAQRTGAATAIAAKYLARKESSTLGILAAGVQGRSNLEALLCLFPIKKVMVYDLYPEVAKSFASDMSKKFQVDIEVVAKPELAVKKMDMVVTSGPILKHPTPVIEANWLSEGAFASPVDFDSYWTGAALSQIDKLTTDDHGQMQYYREVGYFKQTPKAYADLGELVAGKFKGRENSSERTMAINLGIALEDMATAPLIFKRAMDLKIGTKLEL